MAARPLVLRADRVVVPGGVLSPGEVTVRGGSILAVGPAPRRPAPEPGTVLAPGFVDLQVNGAGRHAVADLRSPAAWDEVGRTLLAGGTTTWCATLLSAAARSTAAALRRVGTAADPAGRATAARGSPAGPALAGAHLEGPFLGIPGAHPVEHVRSEVPRRWAASLPAVVRVVTIAPELPGALGAVRDLARRDVLVALGHSHCTAEEAHAGAAAGARLVTHLGNAMHPLHQRDPGLFGAALADPRLAVSLIADLEHVHPDVLRLAFAAKGPDGVVLVTDRVAEPPGLPAPAAGDASPGHGGTVGRLLARRLPGGGLTGTAAGMADMVAGCVLGAGVDLVAAVAAASTTPARLLGLTDRGALAPHRRADVVELVDRDGWLHVRRVWVAGRPPGPGAAERR